MVSGQRRGGTPMRRRPIILACAAGIFLAMAALPLNLQAQVARDEVLECGGARRCTVQQMAEILRQKPGLGVRGIGPKAVALNVEFPVNSSVIPRQYYPDIDAV